MPAYQVSGEGVGRNPASITGSIHSLYNKKFPCDVNAKYGNFYFLPKRFEKVILKFDVIMVKIYI